MSKIIHQAKHTCLNNLTNKSSHKPTTKCLNQNVVPSFLVLTGPYLLITIDKHEIHSVYNVIYSKGAQRRATNDFIILCKSCLNDHQIIILAVTQEKRRCKHCTYIMVVGNATDLPGKQVTLCVTFNLKGKIFE